MNAMSEAIKTRIWVLASALVIVAVLAGGWFLGAQPLLASAAASQSAATAATAQTQALRTTLATVTQKSANLAGLQAAVNAATAAVPSTLDAQGFIGGVDATAADDSVTVKSITPGQALAYTQPASTIVAPAPVATAGSTPSATPTPAATAAAAPVAAVTPEAATDPSITAANFVVVPMSVSVHGSSSNVQKFVTDLRGDKRLFLVNGYTAVSDAAGNGVTATLTGYVYSLTS